MLSSNKNLKLVNKKKQKGAVLVEYALIVALVAFGAFLGMTKLAGSIDAAFQNVGTTLDNYVVAQTPS